MRNLPLNLHQDINSNILVLILVYTFRDLSWNQLKGPIPTNRLASTITTMYVPFNIFLVFWLITANFYVLAVIYHITLFKELFHQTSQGYLVFSSCKYYLAYSICTTNFLLLRKKIFPCQKQKCAGQNYSSTYVVLSQNAVLQVSQWESPKRFCSTDNLE